ncbi:Cytochrome c oxidase subunit 7A1, mitochondrial [Eumeta japonica]|uniref:Cytochrome c oxidase subunit 7A1, mitochondrial n=1 Tax=Eumeta variegata TaxID=151549 RepID=A0A4C1Z830_EUMVA|nr:Cytochrome c oxidase subunit 7A1, mitochondrial [Eumeta japonica]
MYHQLCKVTGRLVASTHLQAPLYPVAPIALQRVEPPSIKYTTTHMSTVAKDACAAPPKQRLVPGTNIPFSPVPESIVKKQKQFLKEDDVPVFLKGGPMDVLLYRLTMGLCVVAIISVAHTIYTLAWPKKN